MKTRGYYRECPDCGANNDPNEICECKKYKGLADMFAAGVLDGLKSETNQTVQFSEDVRCENELF